MTTQSQMLVVEIDSQIAHLIEDINSAPQGGPGDSFVDDFQDMLVGQLIGPFGLSRSMFNDVDGGAVTSLHNFEKGVVANEADAARYAGWQKAQSTPFERTDYNKALDKAFPDMISSDGKYYDAYTGQEIPQGPLTSARDHVVSACEVERSSKGHLAQTRAERVATATQKENVVLAAFGMNSSKGESDLMEWAAKPNADDPTKTNAEFYNLDEQEVKTIYRKAKDAVDKKQDAAVLRKQAGEILVEGGKAAGKLAVRQVLGLVLKDLIQGVVADIRHLMKVGYENLAQLAALAERRVKQTWARIRERWAEYLKEGVTAGLSGFLSTVVTLLINAVVTTVKNVVAMIREGVLAFARAVKTIVAPAPGTTPAEIAREVAKILAAAVAACVGLALEEVIAKALQAIPLLAPLATYIAPVIAGILSGSLALLALLAFDQLRATIEFRNKELVSVHRGQLVNLLRIKQTVVVLGRARGQMEASRDRMVQEIRETDRQIAASRADTQHSLDAYAASVADLKLAFGDLQ